MREPLNPAMLTDLYELTMAAAYHRRGMHAPATFSLFIREYPPDRGFFVAAGLEDVLEYLESFRFEAGDLEYLDGLGLFSARFLEFLGGLRFTGDVVAVPEGRLFFRDEPILEVTAAIVEAQVGETFVINAVNFQTAVATKAARCTAAARGRRLVDFGLRRTHGTDAGLNAARASCLAGFAATSYALAGQRYGLAGPPKSAKTWDKVIVSILRLTELARYILAGVDQRYGWTAGFPVAAQIVAVPICVLSYALFIWAMAANPFFSQVIRIQSDRGHVVATAGPYRYVRHPGYAGMVVFEVAMSTLLASWWAILAGVICSGLIILRTALEDRTLRAELPGYAEYAHRVRYAYCRVCGERVFQSSPG